MVRVRVHFHVLLTVVIINAIHCTKILVVPRILLVHIQDSIGAFVVKWYTKRLHRALAPPHMVVLPWEKCNGGVQLVTTFLFCYVCKSHFSAGISLWKRVCEMPKSGTGHTDAIGFWGHIHAMHWRNSSLQLGNKIVDTFNINSYHGTLIRHLCSVSLIRAHIIQRILRYYNGFCDFHWNRTQRILCSMCAIRLLTKYIRDDLIQTCHWVG